MTSQDAHLRAIADRLVRETPQAVALGIQFVSAEPDVGVMKVGYRPDLVGDPHTGVLAGGVITTLLDHACGLAVSGGRRDGGVATLDLRIDYMRAAEPGRDVFARAHCYKLTNSIAFVRAIAYEDTPEDPIATAQGAFVLAGAPSAGTPP
jgi:uncharacterized protein (TIGR00369 family)